MIGTPPSLSISACWRSTADEVDPAALKSDLLVGEFLTDRLLLGAPLLEVGDDPLEPGDLTVVHGGD